MLHFFYLSNHVIVYNLVFIFTFSISIILPGGNSHHGATSGSAYGKTDCSDIQYGSGGGGDNGGAGGNYLQLDVGTVGFFFLIFLINHDKTFTDRISFVILYDLSKVQHNTVVTRFAFLSV